MKPSEPKFLKLPPDTPENATVVVRRDSMHVLRVDPVTSFSKHGNMDEHQQDDFIKEENLYKRLHLDHNTTSRFSTPEKIGEGSSGIVYALRDENCAREVAIKILKDVPPTEYHEEIQRFITEGRTVANLEHPSIIPIYDLDVDENGQVYLCMRRVNGHTLHEYIQRKENGIEDDVIHTEYDLIQVVLKVCDALAFAHSKNHIHQDIKPDNIMIGQFGQVFVIDWGASSCTCDELALTPVYMSPQQARAMLPSVQDDIYCLGASLFHCLVGRYPTDGEALEELIQKKQEGVIDPLTEVEQANVSKPLLAIVMKALSANPKQRYKTIEEFAGDLKNYLEGKAVNAYEYSIFEFLTRWANRHRHGILTFLLVIAILFSAGAIFYKMKLQEVAKWGQPFLTEDFDDNSWQNDWILKEGSFQIEDGRIVSTSQNSFQLLYRKKLVGSHAIEFEGEMLPGMAGGDLSVIWFDDMIWNPDGTVKKALNPTFIQTGAFGNSFAMIYQKGTRLDHSEFRNKNGKRYKIRAEVDGAEIRLFIDGKLLCHATDVFQRSGGYICIYGYYPGKAFDNIKIYRKGLPQKAKVTMVGDSYFRAGLHSHAIEFFNEVERSHPGKKIAEEARYKRGASLYQLEQKAEAYETWNDLQKTQWWPYVQTTRAKDLLQARKYDEMISVIKDLCANDKGRRLTVQFWDRAVSRLTSEQRPDVVEKLIAIRNENFPNESLHNFALASHLGNLGKHEEILERYPELSWSCASVLGSLERFEEVLERYPDQGDMCARALLKLNRYEEVLRKYPELHNHCAVALIRLGRAEEAVERYKDHPTALAMALNALGRYEEVLKLQNVLWKNRELAARLLGKTDELFEQDAKLSKWERKRCAEHLGRLPEWIEQYNATDGSSGVFDARLSTGEFDRALAEYPFRHDRAAMALVFMNQFERARKEYPLQRYAEWVRLYYQGDYEQALKRTRGVDNWVAIVLNAMGRHDHVLRVYHQQNGEAAVALISLGRYDEASRMLDNPTAMILAADALAVEALKNGDKDLANRRLSTFNMAQTGFREDEIMTTEYIVKPLLWKLSGRNRKSEEVLKTITRTYKATYSQKLWHMAAYIQGQISDTDFMAQPFQVQAKSRLSLAQAIKRELDDQPGAVDLYNQYSKLKRHEKEVAPVVDLFVTWRIEELSK